MEYKTTYLANWDVYHHAHEVHFYYFYIGLIHQNDVSHLRVLGFAIGLVLAD